MGTDDKDRPCAKRAVHVNDGGRITIPNLLFLIALLALPALALHHLRTNLLWVCGYSLLIGWLTYLSYSVDKQRARKHEWRISENSLHLLELLGGWTGAWLAQKRFRHKCSKDSYQFAFWFIVFAYQVTSLDYLLDWKIWRTVWPLIQ